MNAPVLRTSQPVTTDSTTPRPLLPPLLLGAGAIFWLWVLPIAVLLAANLQGYGLVEGEMSSAQRWHAWGLGAGGVLNLAAGVAVMLAMRRQARMDGAPVFVPSAWWGVPAIVVQTAYLWTSTAWINDVLPRSVTVWIYPEERFLYNQFALAMPALFWGILRVACARPAAQRPGKTLSWSLGAALGAPALLYVVGVIWFNSGLPRLGPVVVALLVVGLGLVMFLGITRALAHMLGGLPTWNGTKERAAIVLFAGLFPFAGLLLNREIPFPNDFQATEVYVMTGANLAVLLLASWWHERRPVLSVALLGATLPFTLYFFAVFLPFLPVSVLAVIAMGAGFLVLTPTVLLMLHLRLLHKARRGAARGRRWVAGALGCALLPGFFVVRGLADKAALNAALDYVYAPKIEAGPRSYAGSRVNLKRALANHRSYKNGVYYPLLSDFYAWLVFDDLVLPDAKLARLETTFFGQAGSAQDDDWVRSGRGNIWGRSNVRDRHRMPRSAPVARTVEVAGLAARAARADEGATTVTLALTLQNTGVNNAEYLATLPLAPGVVVNGFRMRVNGEMVPGRITEKKTALWVYTMIRDSERRDPGLLFYNAPDELELRVFPVVAGTPGEVEIDFLVPAPVGVDTLAKLAEARDPARVTRGLGEALEPTLATTSRGAAVVGLAGAELPAVKRDRYVHVIVDRSEKNGFDGDWAAALRGVRERFPDARFVRVMLANYETREVGADAADIRALPLRGGFVADLAVAQALRQHRDEDLAAEETESAPARPVFVFLGRELPKEQPGWDVTRGWADLVPAIEVHAVNASGRWSDWAADAAERPLVRRGRQVRPVLADHVTRFEPAGSEASGAREAVEYFSPNEAAWRPVSGLAGRAWPAGALWSRAMELQSEQQDHDRSPGSGVELKALVAASRESGVMLASTSYIVVENSAQRKMLEVSERQKLGQNAALELKEAPAPSAVWLAPALAAWLWWRSRRRARTPDADNRQAHDCRIV